MRQATRTSVTAVLGLWAGLCLGQEATPAEAPAEKQASPPFRPIESNVIVNLPSVDVPPAGTLTLLVTHRFVTPIQDGSINNFFTLDTGNTWGFGLWYAPLKNFNVGFYRSAELATYELSGEYELPKLGGFSSAVRLGEDWRTQVLDIGNGTVPYAASPKSSFFAQAVLAWTFGKYVRLTVVPTYLQRTNGVYEPFDSPPPGDESCRPSGNPPPAPPYTCSGLYAPVFNVPVAASIALTHSITVHAEVTPRLSAVNSSGVGWAVTVEKSLLRHRFAFFAGNQRNTTVDRYLEAVPYRRNAKDVYIGFNLYRAWKLN